MDILLPDSTLLIMNKRIKYCDIVKRIIDDAVKIINCMTGEVLVREEK